MSTPAETFRAVVLAATGGAPEHIETGKLHRFSTNGKRGDVAGWCKLFDDERGGVYGCNRQGLNEHWSAVDQRQLSKTERLEYARQMAQAREERRAEQQRVWAENAQKNASLWAECWPLVPGDPVSLYLKRRLLAPVWPKAACLRFHPALPYWHEGETLGRLPAMVAQITAPSGRLLALHRTYLTRDGRKADVPVVKKITAGAGPLMGGCIRLGTPGPARVIGVAEGIETALAASMGSGLPVVAAYSAGALAGWVWPLGVASLVIFGDADKAGREAAEQLRDRAQAEALGVRIVTPRHEGMDWCDVWASRDDAAVSRASQQMDEFEPANREGQKGGLHD